MAERLEERGVEIVWQVFRGVSTSTLAKVRTDLQLKPAFLFSFPYGEPSHYGEFDAVISSHSYLAWHFPQFPTDVVRMIDFHNLEWRTLLHAAKSVRGMRALHPFYQVALMRRYERRAVKRCDVASFPSQEELVWAQSSRPRAQLLLLPSVLPRTAEAQALALSRGPANEIENRLAYVGSLDFKPNMTTLIRFLRVTWPAIREAVADVRLTIAGACSDADRHRLNEFPGVEALGFVNEVAPLLRGSAAVILPVESWGGTSLRALYYAIAEIPVIGSPAAFRGLPWQMDRVAATPHQWVDAVNDVVADRSRGDARRRAAHDAAMALQRLAEPWDRLISGLSDRRHALMRSAALDSGGSLPAASRRPDQ